MRSPPTGRHYAQTRDALYMSALRCKPAKPIRHKSSASSRRQTFVKACVEALPKSASVS